MWRLPSPIAQISRCAAPIDDLSLIGPVNGIKAEVSLCSPARHAGCFKDEVRRQWIDAWPAMLAERKQASHMSNYRSLKG